MPLASRRDKVTEVRWGMADFRRRFGRDPEGMWLPETAVDPETLDVLAAEGIAFTILAPHQVEHTPADGSAGRYRTSGGRSIALCVYDGAIAHDVAFGPLLKDAAAWAERLLAPGKRGSQRRLVAVATDGETYGHHHKFGEVALAWVVREALDWLAGGLHARFEREGGALFDDPWAVRDAYGMVVGGASGGLAQFVAQQLRPRADRTAEQRARELLELERNALRMFTSCGWFFDDIAGIETIQILRYAARAIELAGADAPRLEAGMLERLSRAESNEPGEGTGRDV